MRILVIGAGAVGGYFGGRLLEAGRDVTFLVRPERAARLARNGLEIKSDVGNVTLRSPPTVLAAQLREAFDVVLLTCKSYDLDAAIDAFAPAVGPDTAIIPLLNGMRHLDVLDERIGADHVLGGQSLISARLDDAGRIVHLSDIHRLTFGERVSEQQARSKAIAAGMGGALFEVKASDDILLDMWEKWVFLATLASVNCLMRAAIGDVVAAGGASLITTLLGECQSIAATTGRAPRPAFLDLARSRLTEACSPMTASMLNDLERGGRTEADHILGDLLRRRPSVSEPDRSLLQIAYTAVKASEARVNRERTSKSAAS
jgi:2-dehydropantoate 2-reductase